VDGRGAGRSAHRLVTFLIGVLFVPLLASSSVTTGTAKREVDVTAAWARESVSAETSQNAGCNQTMPPRMADQLLADRYHLRPLPSVRLPPPENLTWAEDPFGDANWQYRFHSLSWVLSLLQASSRTGNPAYLERAVDLARSWVERNPPTSPPSTFSWNNMATAIRAIVLTCLAESLRSQPAWLNAALARSTAERWRPRRSMSGMATTP
jgi:hypothetical protein